MRHDEAPASESEQRPEHPAPTPADGQGERQCHGSAASGLGPIEGEGVGGAYGSRATWRARFSATELRAGAGRRSGLAPGLDLRPARTGTGAGG